ncbi:MAG: BTAD domain-containing putative transcriptional regulator [Actinomycetota bacterium]
MATLMTPGPGAELNLIRGFELRCNDRAVEVKPAAQRLLAFLALHGGRRRRSFIAGSLWFDSPDRRASANLRSSLWRLNETAEHTGVELVHATSTHVELSADLTVDLTEASQLAEQIVHGAETDVSLEDERLLRRDVLPDWYDDWVTIERERFRQLRLHALERLCQRYIDQRRFGCAINAGLAIVAAEPLRESAHRRVIEAHIAEGNRREARRHYEHLASLLREELGVCPSPAVTALAGALVSQ